MQGRAHNFGRKQRAQARRQDIAAANARASELWKSGRPEEAAAQFELVLALDPADIAALEGMGLVQVVRGDERSAQTLFERVLDIEPTRLIAQINLADLLYNAGRPDEAQTLIDRVLVQEPNHPLAHYLAGNILRARGDYEAAARSFEISAELSPLYAGQIETESYERLGVGDWTGYAPEIALFKKRLGAGLPVWQPMMPMLFSDAPADIAQGARNYAASRFVDQARVWPPRNAVNDRIRIGYLSSSYCDHPVAQVIVGVLEHHDRAAFDVFAFSHSPATQDEHRRRIVPAFEHFVEIGPFSDAAAAHLINDCRIDILVALDGYTGDARPGILTHRPAPVQVNYLGYPGTMGVPFVDYMIADRHVIPHEDVRYFAESIAWMPDTYQPTDDKAQVAVGRQTRAEQGLPEGAFVFMAYNHINKISPAMFDAWMRILRRVDNAVLWLRDRGPRAQENLRREAAARGVDPRRVAFAPHMQSRAEHVARHRLADLFLDSLPYNAHTTASDALWAGLPVMTCRGATFPGRVCAGLLTVAGMADMVTESLEDYEALAVALAGDPQRLAALRRRVERDVRASSLFDTARYTRNLESAYRTMVEISREGDGARSFGVVAAS